MAFMITTDCINCDACESECPNEAISTGEDFCEINPLRCTQCIGHYNEPQCIAICPVDCIVVHPEHQETREELEAKYRQLMAAAN